MTCAETQWGDFANWKCRREREYSRRISTLWDAVLCFSLALNQILPSILFEKDAHKKKANITNIENNTFLAVDLKISVVQKRSYSVRFYVDIHDVNIRYLFAKPPRYSLKQACLPQTHDTGLSQQLN